MITICLHSTDGSMLDAMARNLTELTRYKTMVGFKKDKKKCGNCLVYVYKWVTDILLIIVVFMFSIISSFGIIQLLFLLKEKKNLTTYPIRLPYRLRRRKIDYKILYLNLVNCSYSTRPHLAN